MRITFREVGMVIDRTVEITDFTFDFWTSTLMLHLESGWNEKVYIQPKLGYVVERDLTEITIDDIKLAAVTTMLETFLRERFAH